MKKRLSQASSSVFSILTVLKKTQLNIEAWDYNLNKKKTRMIKCLQKLRIEQDELQSKNNRWWIQSTNVV